jgi:hypothetical protein
MESKMTVISRQSMWLLTSAGRQKRFYPECKGKSVPLQAWSSPEGSRKLRFPDFMTTAQDGVKFVSLTHRPTLPPGNAPGTHFCYRLSRSQGHSAIGSILCKWKISITPAGIKPTTFRFGAQHPNHCATAVPRFYPEGNIKNVLFGIRCLRLCHSKSY